MKNTIKYISWLILLFIWNIANADINWWIFFTDSSNGDWGVFWPNMWDKLKSWDIHVDDIANMIRNAIEFFMSLVWLVAIIFIIIWAYQILFWSLSDDKQKWKNTVTAAIIWLALAILSWFIVKIIFDNLS